MASRIPASVPHEWDGIFRDSFMRSTVMLCGVALAIAALLLLIALATFSSADASLTTAAQGADKNWLGVPGARVASLGPTVLRSRSAGGVAGAITLAHLRRGGSADTAPNGPNAPSGPNGPNGPNGRLGG